jgi:hypothetical protein
MSKPYRSRIDKRNYYSRLKIKRRLNRLSKMLLTSHAIARMQQRVLSSKHL